LQLRRDLMVVPLAALLSGALWAWPLACTSSPRSITSVSAASCSPSRRCLLPRAIIDHLVIGRAWSDQVGIALHPPVSILEAFPRIRDRGAIQQAPSLQFMRLQQALGFRHKVVGVARWILVDQGGSPCLRAEQRRQGGTIQVIASGFSPRRIALHEHAE